MGETEFNSDLFCNCHWVLSDSISKFDYAKRKTLTESIKDAIVASEQRYRGMYANPLMVNFCPRISNSLNPNSIDALPLFEDGMSDKMMLLKVEKSSILPEVRGATRFCNLSRLQFEAEIGKALPAYAYFLKHEFQVPEEIRETDSQRFNIKTYHHPWILDQINDVKRHVHLAEMLYKWRDLYGAIGSALDMWSALTKYDTESVQAVRNIAASAKTFGRIMTELAEATKEADCYCRGVRVLKLPRGDSRGYQVLFADAKGQKPTPEVSVGLMEKLRQRASN